MTREKRIRRRKIKRSKRLHRRIGFLLLSLLAGLLLSATYLVSAMSSASLKSDRQKYYKSITVQAGDTLWDIADKYISDEYVSKKDYIKEVSAINHLSGSKINAGARLCLPYYQETADFS